jgi:segregation and condensation protein A
VICCGYRRHGSFDRPWAFEGRRVTQPPPKGPLPRPAGYQVKVPGFEGPLDLLVQLAHQGKVDLTDVSLFELTNEFLVKTKSTLELNEATEALWMLAALVEMKAKGLLPKPAPSEPPPEAESSDLPEKLEERLADYRAYKEAAEALRALEEVQQNVFSRTPAERPPELILEGVTVDDLFKAFQAVLTRVRKSQAAEVADEPVRVADRRVAILEALRAAPGGVEFERLFPQTASLVFIIVTFLALLDLIKDRAVGVQQSAPLAPIRLFAVTAP